MPEYIAKEKAKEAVDYAIELSKSAYDMMCAAINQIPAANVAPVVHGRWLFGKLNVFGASVKCSNCGWSVERVDPIRWIQYKGHQFCGCCGAQMDLEE